MPCCLIPTSLSVVLQSPQPGNVYLIQDGGLTLYGIFQCLLAQNTPALQANVLLDTFIYCYWVKPVIMLNIYKIIDQNGKHFKKEIY